MSFEQNLKDYMNFYKIGFGSTTPKIPIEPAFENLDAYNSALNKEIQEKYLETKHTFDYRTMVNTSSFADCFVNRVDDSSDLQAEVGMMFIKTYIRQLLLKTYGFLSPKTMVSFFNKNQELVEIPYPLALYIGGMYYFTTNESKIDAKTYIKNQNSPDLYDRINGVNTNLPKNELRAKDVYSINELYRIPLKTLKLQSNGLNKITYPSTRILNRSVYQTEGGPKNASNETEFLLKYSEDGDTRKLFIPDTGAMPGVGFGIQNKFLNYYNKKLFGDYLNGEEDNFNNKNRPHVLAGGYSGIIKPIKTYESDDVEFTALYRCLNVENYSYDIPILVNELSEITKNINLKTNEADLKKHLIKSFIVYSKLKATYLSGNYNEKEELKEVITQFSKISNIESEYNKEVGVYDATEEKLFDLYYLVAHFFFTTFNYLIPEKIVQKNNNAEHHFDLLNRLFFGKNLIEINNKKIDYTIYQKECIGTKLFELINSSKTIDNQIESLTNFLRFIWNFEKINHKLEYNKVDGKSVYALYPSAGGFISPNGVLRSLIDDSNIIVTKNNSIDENIQNINTKISFNETKDENLKKIGSYFPGKTLDYTAIKTTEQIFFSNKVKSLGKKLFSNLGKKYIVEGKFDSNNFLNNYCFSNHAILNNTSRFLWYDSTDLGDNLKLDRNVDENSTFMFYESDSGLNSAEYNLENNYFNNLYTLSFNYYGIDLYNSSGYLDYYKFQNILDTIDFEKLRSFKDLFLDFCNLSNKERIYDGTYNLKSLLLASSVIKNEEIKEITDEKTAISLTAEEVNLLLIGNSMFQYDFCSVTGISKFLNIALTTSQKTRVETVIDEFCSHTISIANTSALGSLTYETETMTAPQISLHNFQTSPEILFSNAKDYDSLITLMGGETENVTKYLSRRIIFGNQFVEAYETLSASEEKEIKILNNFYLKNRLINRNVNNLAFGSFGDIKSIDEIYFLSVKKFFQFLNIKYKKEHYRHLIKLLRSFVFLYLKKYNLINEKYLPSNSFISYSEFIKDVTPIQPNIVSEDDINGLTNDFFKTFNKLTVNGTLTSMNTAVSSLSTYFTNKVAEVESGAVDDSNDLQKQINSIKKTTYYNIKSIYEKLNSTDKNDTKLFKNFIKLEELSGEEVISNLKDLNLFFNFKFDREECYVDPNDINQENANKYDLYQIFQVVDRGNNNIGTKVLANLIYLYNNLYTDFNSNPEGEQLASFDAVRNLTTGSLQKLLSGMAKETGFIFQQIPSYLNINGAIGNVINTEEEIDTMVDHMFGTHTNTGLFGDFVRKQNNVKFGALGGFPGFIYQLGTISSKVDNSINEKRVKNDYLNSFCLDVNYDNNSEISVNTENAPDEILSSNVTCFTVDFGRQNQQMFTSVQLDTSEFYDTEESIRTWVDLVNDNKQISQTTNLFPVFEKRSYSCTVESLGNATIQPLSYFYLRNVPLFYGTYWITNVSHKISPNTMLTSFKGVRQPIASKNDERLQLINLMRQKAKDLLEAAGTANEIIVEGLPDTGGDIIKEITNSVNPYGEVIQKTLTLDKYGKFDGRNLIGAFIYSITNSNEDSYANMGIISVLYNRAKALKTTNDHSVIIKNMKNIAIAYMKDRASRGDVRYDDGAKSLSISRLFKESGNGFNGANIGQTNVSQSKLGELIDAIVDEQAFNDKIVLKENINILGSKIAYTANAANQITKNTEEIKFTPLEKITFDSKILPIKEAVQFYENKNNYNPSLKLSFSFTSTIYDIFNSLKENNPVGSITTVNTQQKLLSVQNAVVVPFTEEYSQTLGSSNFGSIPIPQSNSASASGKNETQKTSVPGVLVKYLGQTEDGVSFFSFNESGQWGNITYTEAQKNYLLLEAANETDIGNIVERVRLGVDPNRENTIQRLVSICNEEYAFWGNGSVKECSNQETKDRLSLYWASVPGRKALPYCSEAWSAAFISYVMKKAAVADFPYAASHNVYITHSRDNKGTNGSWYAYDVASNQAVVDVGDLVCYTREGTIGKTLAEISSGDLTHCDCVVEVNTTTKLAYALGGNVSNSVSRTTFALFDDGKVNPAKNKAICVIKYSPVASNISGGSEIPGASADCSTPTPLVDPSKAVPASFTTKKVGVRGGVKFDNIGTKSRKYIYEEIMPIIENNFSHLSKGFRCLMVAQVIKEGFYPGARAYSTLNPGNIGNTDSGKNIKEPNLHSGIKKLEDRTKQYANPSFKPPIRKTPYYSPELKLCVSPPNFNTYTGELWQYLMIYATGARVNNTYLSFILGFFKFNGLNITYQTKISEIINMN